MKSELPVIYGRISQLIANRRGYAIINNLCTLTYYTEDEFGRKCDEMMIVFRHVSGVPDGVGFPIKSRKVDEIISEIQDYTVTYFQKIVDRVVDDLGRGVASE